MDAVALFGTTQPVPERRKLTAGRLSVIWDEGALRTIRYDGIEILRSIAFLSRDEAWRNNPAGISNLDIVEKSARFRIAFDMAIVGGAQRLTATARIDGSSDGGLKFTVTATAETDFKTNRTGFTVLHPLEYVVDQPVEVIHTDGARAQRRFPGMISPGQPIFDIRSLTHDVGRGLRATILMEGAKFEMEDHRNWMDASYKTYSGSLLDPWPYVIACGERVTQSITLTVAGRSAAEIAGTAKTGVSVALGKRAECLPAFGTALPLKSVTSVLDDLDVLEQAAPAFLVGRIDRRRRELNRQLADLARIARATDIPLRIELILSAKKSAHREIENIAASLARADVAPEAVVVTQAHDMMSFQPGDPRPEGPSYAEMAAAARAFFPGIPVGGGVVAFFTELNRLPVPRGQFDFITHAVCPAVHASDDLSLMENLEAAKWIFASTRNMIGTTPYHLGPSWLSSRVNPYGSSIFPNPENERICLPESDPRQHGLFGAAWLLGLAAAASEAGLASVGLASATGPNGLICGSRDRKPTGHSDARVTPAYHVFKGLAVHRSCHRLETTCTEPTVVAALGIGTATETQLWLANLTAREQRVKIKGWNGFAEVHLVDETQFADALQVEFLAGPGIVVERVESLSLGAYAIARFVSPRV